VVDSGSDTVRAAGLAVPSSVGVAGRGAAAATWRACRFVLALFLFVGALQLMKMGAAGLGGLGQGDLLVKNAGSTLGLGWIGAMCLLSGSPVAASALALAAAGSISDVQAFTMLTGSRLGAAFVVLLVAVVYALRGGAGQRRQPVSTAVIALATTALVYVPGAIVGLALLQWVPFREVDLRFPVQFGDIVDLVYGGLLDPVRDLSPPLLFGAGLGVLLASFKLVDSVLPELGDATLERSRLGWVRRKWPMFGLGCLVALVTMSVSVALTVLVPLVAKGRVKREDIIPYIMGANITTLGDTLLAAFVLGPAPVQIVLAGIIGTSAVSLALLTFFYRQVMAGVWRFQLQIVRSRARLASFTAALFLVPLAIIAVSGALGWMP
jgi:sodium-dependent phosphate cotransporter